MDLRHRTTGSSSPPVSPPSTSKSSLRHLRWKLFYGRYVSSRCSVLLAVFVLFLLVLGPSLVDYLFLRNHASDNRFLKHDDCPMCFGTSVCGNFHHGRVRLTGLKQYPFFMRFNPRNVLHAQWHIGPAREVPVVLKKLGSDRHLSSIQRSLCLQIYREKRKCVGQAARQALWHHLGIDGDVSVEHARKSSVELASCLSARLFDRIVAKYREKTDTKGGLFLRTDQLPLLYAFKVNPEPLILQAFPYDRSRWPHFPRYFGACGQWVLVQDRGTPLSEVARSADLRARLAVAVSLLRMAREFTEGLDDFSFFPGDWSWDNFAVRGSTVALIDLSDLLVVDRRVRSNENLVAPFDPCPSDNRSACHFTWDPARLCASAGRSDFNFYAVCRRVLAPSYANEERTGGLVPDLAQHPVAQGKDVDALMDRCARPLVGDDRSQIALRLQALLSGMLEEMSGPR